MSESTPPALGPGLSTSHAQEQFSKAFVLAVAALAGRSAAEPDRDVDDVGWSLSCRTACPASGGEAAPDPAPGPGIDIGDCRGHQGLVQKPTKV
jgi:hypothetical protein